MEQEFASTLLENAVSEFAQLPGIGRKTALRLVLYLLKQQEDVATRFGARKFDIVGCVTTSARARCAPSAPIPRVTAAQCVWLRT